MNFLNIANEIIFFLVWQTADDAAYTIIYVNPIAIRERLSNSVDAIKLVLKHSQIFGSFL